MNMLLKMVSIMGLMFMAPSAYTAEITDTYSTGDTLTATTLGTIKGAVNDNDKRTSAVETKISDMQAILLALEARLVALEDTSALEAKLVALEHTSALEARLVALEDTTAVEARLVAVEDTSALEARLDAVEDTTALEAS
jgi:uncharacterized coiled-coil protein SlyX